MEDEYYEKVLKGCGKVFNHGMKNEVVCGINIFCLECQAKLEALKEAWKEELEFLEELVDEKHNIKLGMGYRIKQLKERLEQ